MNRIHVFILATVFAASGYAEQRPNILWLTCEDISPYLGCYGFEQARTPHLDKLAEEGIRFTRAYANAPVCAVARSALLTGMHSPTIGTHQMRSMVQLPEIIPAYPKLFREAGYYCTNNSKQDYNSNFQNDPSLWDESSGKADWKNRPPGAPFFAVFNTTVTHESQLSAKAQQAYLQRRQIPQTPRVDPSQIELPPYHPDLPEIRRDWARLHDLITLMDTIIGRHLQQLQSAGAADDTIVFFYSDHGGQLSRSKRYIYNVGTQVPLVVRFPRKWQHLAPSGPGSTYDEIAQFVDLPKTVLALAGIDPPEEMQGRILFGPGREAAPANAHFYRDRMAERYDFSRAVTDGRHYFIRNFMPHRPRGRDAQYGYQVQANWRAWRQWYDQDPETAGPIRSQFYQPKPAIELFDTRQDPWHVYNLADEEGHKETVRKLEADLDGWMIQTRDCGLIPEPLVYELIGPDHAHPTLYEYAQSDAYPIETILSAAKIASAGDPSGLDDCLKMLLSDNPIIRHWGAYGIFAARTQDDRSDAGESLRTDGARQSLARMIQSDAFAGNRVMAAQALAMCGDGDTAFAAIMKEAQETNDGYVFLFALNALQYSHTDDRLTREDWQRFNKRGPEKGSGRDDTGFGYAKRIVKDALDLWPQRRKVD